MTGLHASEAGWPLEYDTQFSEQEYDEMLAEVRDYLPAFLSPAATEQHDPVGDVKELLRLEQEDLDRVLSVHVCLSDQVSRFVAALDRGLRRPHTSTDRPEEVTQAIRGPIDWGATTRRRSLAGGDPSLFVVRPGQRIFETPENQALAWSIRQLQVTVGRAARSVEEAEAETAGWMQRLGDLSSALRRARRVEWLREVQPVRPTARVRQRLAAVRRSFYRHDIAAVVELLLRSQAPDGAVLTEVLCNRYFVPAKQWRLFEVLVALRVSRELSQTQYSKSVRKTRLLQGGEGVQAYARYELLDGTEVQLFSQGWPRRKPKSIRSSTAKHHGFSPRPTIPDLFVLRVSATGKEVLDAVIVEIKATKSSAYLGQGLFELLGYLGEQPDLLAHTPAGWLVAPASDAFSDASPAVDLPLWMVTADEVASKVSQRMATSP